MSKSFVETIVGIVPSIFNGIVSALGLHNKTKIFLLAFILISIVEFPLAFLEGIQIYQKIKYNQNNINRYPMSAPSMVK